VTHLPILRNKTFTKILKLLIEKSNILIWNQRLSSYSVVVEVVVFFGVIDEIMNNIRADRFGN